MILGEIDSKNTPPIRGPGANLEAYLAHQDKYAGPLNQFYNETPLYREYCWDGKKARHEEFKRIADSLLPFIGGSAGARKKDDEVAVIGIGLSKFSACPRFSSLDGTFASYFVQLAFFTGARQFASMDNKTVSDAIAVHGTNPQFLIEKILRTRIYESKYWKEQCFGLTESTIIEKAFNLNYIGGQYGTQKPTEFICLVLKLLQLQPNEEIVIKYITGLSEDDDMDDSNKYLRALGAFYLRLTGKPATIYKVLEPLLDDPRKLRKRTLNGFVLTYMDEFIDELLREERVCDVVLPRLTKRFILEDSGDLDPRESIQEPVKEPITHFKIFEKTPHKSFSLKIAVP
ncbi:hypothetical protein DFQ26_007082 [Actinomortierella ambigua]|nr:hypothetical protein DFQ26_007082 [Actinomortierella ambigua]